ncbi:hypothetical protein AA313_de0210213 [Arthrobotrys entomopaga]|nr:hypothetical protein AA313_de0210213 [Arthrobotrys entomopaga]
MSFLDYPSSSISSTTLTVTPLPPHSIFHGLFISSKKLGIYYFLFIWIPVFGVLIIFYKQKPTISISLLKRFKYQLESKEACPAVQERRSLKTDAITISYRALYHELQNAENYPDIYPKASNRLQELFDLTLSQALKDVHPTILSINKYNLEELQAFLSNNETQTSQLWTEYLNRRAKGGRELLPTRSYAEHWLRLAAPVKYVDGAWLSRIHHADTPLSLRPITRIAWQIFSEELGDGDLAKNHVHVYSKLLESIGVDVGTGDSSRFVDASENPGNDPRVWAAAVAQLALGLFPGELLPEILGFNLAFEAVTLETLICIHELKELNLDPTYFSLHVTIDNADSGHTAMALEAVAELMKTYQHSVHRDTIWRRVQAGYVLAQGLPVTPRALTKSEWAVLDIFSNKCGPAKAAHQGCKTRINGKALRDWMDPKVWGKHKFSFLEALGSSPWISPGKPSKSRLIKEITWEGRMFGAFTQKETDVLNEWISDMEYFGPASYERGIQQARGTYDQFIGDALFQKVLQSTKPQALPDYTLTILPEIPNNSGFSDRIVSPKLLLAITIPLQHYISIPAKAATVRGMTALRILRLFNGLNDVGDLVAGMDEVLEPSGKGIMEIAQQLFKSHASCKETILGNEWDWLRTLSMNPERNFWFLVGVQYAMVLLINNIKYLSIVDESLGAIIQSTGSKVEGELETLGFRDHEESKQGFWALMNFMNQNCIFD